MKILRLTSENVKRLHAVEITPDGATVMIGGKNGAGKSSVLDSIAYALGGEKLVPSQPIRDGEMQAKVMVDLGDLIVTRKFTRDYLPCDCGVTSPGDVPIVGDEEQHLKTCASKTKFGETRSTLTVTNKDGARYPSPQAVLDKLLGKLTFDPLYFARALSKEQNETLRRLVNLDTSQLDEKRKETAQQRLLMKRSYDIKTAQLLALPTYKDAPPTEISVEVISQEMLRAEELRKIADDADRMVAATKTKLESISNNEQTYLTRVEELQRQVTKIQEELTKVMVTKTQEQKTLEGFEAAATAARQAVPDMNVIRQKLTETEAANTKVRANKSYATMAAEIDAIGAEVKKHDTLIEQIDAGKQAALEAVKYPVPGLGLNDDGVTLNNIPFEQASSSEQIRVSVAIGLALNPQLKVLLIRNGNMLDSDSLRAITEQAKDADAQLWVEWVTQSKEGMAVMLEDGSIV